MEHLEYHIREIAQRHNLNEASAAHLVQGLLRTRGAQVQFNIPEFGGLGQWMPGMVMAGSMSDHALKSKVDQVCTDIAQRIKTGQLTPDNTPATQNANATQAAFNRNTQHWYPEKLGTPATTGSQNDLRYAWFPTTQRLAVDLHGKVWIYNTLDHQISGVSQQQSPSGTTLTFTSQHGVIDLATLPVISRD